MNITGSLNAWIGDGSGAFSISNISIHKVSDGGSFQLDNKIATFNASKSWTGEI